MNSMLSKGPRDTLASSFQWLFKHCKLKLYPPKLEFPVRCISGESWVQFELGKWDVSCPVLPVACPSASHDFFAESSVERITTPSALQAVCLFLGSCCTWAPSLAAGAHFASVTETWNVRMTVLAHTRQWRHRSFPWLFRVLTETLPCSDKINVCSRIYDGKYFVLSLFRETQIDTSQKGLL